ncbi:hypothetical protein vBKpnAMK4_00457 [Klebsiella phage vB_Kpn_AM_K4]|jgi:hypothetical protein|uniref:Uncharacterized protein n=9 Tax=Viruses TaxID=10239 RepID=A0A0K1Y549_9CAUD|nr:MULTISPECIES: hypothetical protein [Klebsiella]YP_009190660.1 hypothetical protein AU097_gp079 [Klebsiella phage JD18]YP_009288771.1 hypothetical protein kpv477_095 [Klebsiella phage vB_KpnM_KpV477]YP_010096064.1 hypothetical protein KNT92_gp089 [Klebsiella phage Mineola]AUV57435.1 hypothetical protein KP1_76 [Klebsiella phage KP1]QGF21507.1 hypothetical protein JIPhKp122_0075 [Klebsiella phage JIPh_Kp122]QPX73803.1 hypothetical protein EVAN_185 [Klebsiella phage vB_KpnM_BovinicusUrsus]QQ
MATLISNDVKRVLFKGGMYIVDTPKGDTSSWTINEWINYIDENGAWVQ